MLLASAIEDRLSDHGECDCNACRHTAVVLPAVEIDPWDRDEPPLAWASRHKLLPLG